MFSEAMRPGGGALFRLSAVSVWAPALASAGGGGRRLKHQLHRDRRYLGGRMHRPIEQQQQRQQMQDQRTDRPERPPAAPRGDRPPALRRQGRCIAEGGRSGTEGSRRSRHQIARQRLAGSDSRGRAAPDEFGTAAARCEPSSIGASMRNTARDHPAAPAPLASASQPASSSKVTPSAAALVAFEPASAPTTTIIGLGRDRARDIGAERLGARLRLGPAHAVERPGEDDRLAGERRGRAPRPAPRNRAPSTSRARSSSTLAVMRLGEKADDVGRHVLADAVDVDEPDAAPRSRRPAPPPSRSANCASER